MRNREFRTGATVALLVWLLYASGVPVVSSIAFGVMAASILYSMALPLWGSIMLILSDVDPDAWGILKFNLGFLVIAWLGFFVQTPP